MAFLFCLNYLKMNILQHSVCKKYVYRYSVSLNACVEYFTMQHAHAHAHSTPLPPALFSLPLFSFRFLSFLFPSPQVRAAFDPHKKRKNPRARKAERAKKAMGLESTLEKRNLLRYVLQFPPLCAKVHVLGPPPPPPPPPPSSLLRLHLFSGRALSQPMVCLPVFVRGWVWCAVPVGGLQREPRRVGCPFIQKETQKTNAECEPELARCKETESRALRE